MPDENGKLTTDERRKAEEWARQKFPEGVMCPTCHTNKWHPDMLMTAQPLATGEDRVPQSPGLYSVNLVCEECGMLLSIDAKVAGIL